MLAKIINVTKQFNKVYHIQRISKLSCGAKVLQTLLSTTFSGNSISYLFLFPELRLDSFDHIPAILNEPIFEKAFNTLEEANLTREQLEQYQKSLLTYWELKGVVDTAHDEGFFKGDKAASERIARSLLDVLDIEKIALKTGLSIEEIKQL